MKPHTKHALTNGICEEHYAFEEIHQSNPLILPRRNWTKLLHGHIMQLQFSDRNKILRSNTYGTICFKQIVKIDEHILK